MTEVTLTVETGRETGTRPSRRLRAEGQHPGRRLRPRRAGRYRHRRSHASSAGPSPPTAGINALIPLTVDGTSA